MKIRRVCCRCGNPVERETHKELRKEYPFYCPTCDENMYRFETEKAKNVKRSKK